MPIWSNERSSGVLETRERRSPPMDGDGNAMMEVTIEDFGGTCERIRTSLPCIDENFIRPYDRDLIRYTLIYFAVYSITYREYFASQRKEKRLQYL